MTADTQSPRGSAVEDRREAGLLGDFFARHQSQLLGALLCIVGNLEDARDALQETFLKCWRRQEQLDQVQNLRAWVFRVALNTGRDLRMTAWRRRRQPLEGDAEMLMANHAPPEADAVRQEELDSVRQAIRQLRAEEQEVFLLRHSGELSYEEVARELDLPLGTVKTRMRMALANLRAAVAE